MPTIIVKKKDLDALVGRKMSPGQLESYLPWVKGEFKEFNEKTDELKVELNDSNRPDLWCTEGIARQIKLKLKGTLPKYPFYRQVPKRTPLQIVVEKGVQNVRPYIAAFGVSNFAMTEEALVQFIQTQEKLADVFGQKRKLLSIGIYHLDPVEFPLIYKAVSPAQARFVPLGFEREMTLQEILEKHPKGKAYRNVFKSEEKVPLFVDQKGTILSFPPIINSREVGEVKPGKKNLFVEVTGTDLRLVNLVLNILATNLFDRGATILPVTVTFPYETAFGKKITFPLEIPAPMDLSVKEVERMLGENFKEETVKKALISYGHAVKTAGKKIKVTPPPFRDDLIHSVDVIEDVAISLGYDSFVPEMPKDFTRGALSKEETFSDTLREYFIGFGFQEIISNILSSREELVNKMNLTEAPLVEIDNVMTAQYSVVRNQILPSLLRVEAASGKAFYPHQIFEIGEVAVRDLSQNLGSKTRLQLSALIAHPTASFSEMHSYWEMLAYYLFKRGTEFYALNASDHPSFIPGRNGWIMMKGEEGPEKEWGPLISELGYVGEISPEVLDRWQIGVPCVSLTLDVTALLTLLS
ncbi:MAG: phenylalanine--tRNA ligase subunit beta [Nitrospirae bacterium]|nr:phenylalanine--tRNA ligase subunit beta [Nitrospirota bacterium]MBI3351773.1 phenylalanine--tRNA ligase subunit beta [Nitrospirota bacterium]